MCSATAALDERVRLRGGRKGGVDGGEAGVAGEVAHRHGRAVGQAADRHGTLVTADPVEARKTYVIIGQMLWSCWTHADSTANSQLYSPSTHVVTRSGESRKSAKKAYYLGLLRTIVCPDNMYE